LVALGVMEMPAFAQLAAPSNVRLVPNASFVPVTITLSPAAAQLSPGAVQQFTAVVSGGTGGVTWGATGGTVQNNGTFTAGAVPGTYLVTASVPGAPPASATVTISGSPVVQILPGQNVQSVVDNQPPGTTFLLKAGVHRRQTITPRTGDTFIGEKSGGLLATILSGARVLGGWSFDGARWYVTGQTQEGMVVGTAAEVCLPTHPRCSFPEDLFFDNVMKYHEDVLGEVGPGEWFFDYANDRIYVGDDPTGHVVEASVTPQLFNPSSADNVTLQDLIVEKYASPSGYAAVNLGHSPSGAENWVVTGVEARWNHGAGIGMDTKTTARNSHTHHNCGFGFVGAGASVVVEGNEIAYNNIAAGPTNAVCGYNHYWGSGGSKWVYTTNLIVRGNFAHHNHGPGLWTDINNIYTLYENNVAEDNFRSGIYHEISYDAIIRNNVARRNGTEHAYPGWTTGGGIEVTSSRNVEIYGNTLENNWQGITGLDDHRGTGIHGPWTLVNFNVHDNTVTSLVTALGGGRTGIADTAGNGAFSATSNNRFNANRYVLGTTLKYFMWVGTDLTEHEWQSYGQDAAGTFQR
jgi:hypothetical protein